MFRSVLLYYFDKKQFQLHEKQTDRCGEQAKTTKARFKHKNQQGKAYG